MQLNSTIHLLIIPIFISTYIPSSWLPNKATCCICLKVLAQLSSGCDLAVSNLATRELDRSFGSAEAFVLADANIKRATQRLGLSLQVRSARLHIVDQGESDSLRSISISAAETTTAIISYVNNTLDLPENSSYWLSNERNGAEQTRFTNEDVQKCLVYADKLTSFSISCGKQLHLTHLAECLKDGIALRSSRNTGHALHLGNSGGTSGHDVRKSGNDLGERALTDDDQRTIDDSDTLSWCLKSLALLGDQFQVGDNLLWCHLCNDGCNHGHRGEKDLVEGNHDDEVVWAVWVV